MEGQVKLQQGLRTIKAEMLACTLCSDLPLGPKPIFQLSEQTKILIVGQAPGRLTHHKGRPFDDPSGDRLRDWLAIDRSLFYTDPRIGIFPMGLCFPGTGPGGDHPPRKVCAATWRSKVMQSLANVELMLVLGAYAIAWHMPEFKGKSVSEAVKQSSSGNEGYFILPHPSPRNNRWLKQNAWFESDVLPSLKSSVQKALS